MRLFSSLILIFWIGTAQAQEINVRLADGQLYIRDPIAGAWKLTTTTINAEFDRTSTLRFKYVIQREHAEDLRPGALLVKIIRSTILLGV